MKKIDGKNSKQGRNINSSKQTKQKQNKTNNKQRKNKQQANKHTTTTKSTNKQVKKYTKLRDEKRKERQQQPTKLPVTQEGKMKAKNDKATETTVRNEERVVALSLEPSYPRWRPLQLCNTKIQTTL